MSLFVCVQILKYRSGLCLTACATQGMGQAGDLKRPACDQMVCPPDRVNVCCDSMLLKLSKPKAEQQTVQ